MCPPLIPPPPTKKNWAIGYRLVPWAPLRARCPAVRGAYYDDDDDEMAPKNAPNAVMRTICVIHQSSRPLGYTVLFLQYHKWYSSPSPSQTLSVTSWCILMGAI